MLALAGLPVSPNIVMQTAAQNTLVISDVPGPTGGIMLKSTTGASIIVNDTGISLTAPKVDITAASINLTVNYRRQQGCSRR